MKLTFIIIAIICGVVGLILLAISMTLSYIGSQDYTKAHEQTKDKAYEEYWSKRKLL